MTTIYKQGDRGAVVKQIQKVAGAYPDGIWGAVTTECVKRWQKAHGIAADGLAGPKTLAMMGISVAVQAVTPSKPVYTVMHGDIALKKSKRRIDYIVIHCTATRRRGGATSATTTSSPSTARCILGAMQTWRARTSAGTTRTPSAWCTSAGWRTSPSRTTS